jgi:tungstate transport system substrate-binding protein
MEKQMKKSWICWLAFLGCLAFTGALSAAPSPNELHGGVYGNGSHAFALATGSPGQLGLVKALAEAFAAKEDATVTWKEAQSGESLRLFKDKAVDMIMVHAPDAEKQAINEGWATKRTLIGSNEFFIVGPPDDPAKIADAKTALEAYTRIAKAEAKFFSRGDNSGTHMKEMLLWKKTGITPGGEWYIVTQDFMSPTMKRANDEHGYFMTDSSTWVAEKTDFPKLKVLFRGDGMLANVYHALCQPPGATSGAEFASKFIDFVGSEQGQKIVREYGQDRYGEGIYNDAAYAKKYE